MTACAANQTILRVVMEGRFRFILGFFFFKLLGSEALRKEISNLK